MTLVLADTSIWVAHFRRRDPLFQQLLAADRILCHPLVVLELACGTPPAPRKRTIGDLKKLLQVVVATNEEILRLIESKRFHGYGCGAIDMALLASVLITPSTVLWTIDRNLGLLAARARVLFTRSERLEPSQ